MNRRVKRAMQVLSPVLLLVAAPLAFSPETGVRENEACAQNGTCCREIGATCVIGHYVQEHAFYRSEGSCRVNQY